MKKLEIRTLTPIWTGNYNGKSISLKATNIIGTLRWWFEAIIRGFGYYACDPTSNPCERKKDKSEVCLACRVFGCNGLRKQFILRVNEMDTTKLFFKTLANERWLQMIYEEQQKVLLGNTTLEIIELKNNIENLISELFFNIEEFGGIGAKTQIGFGQFTIKNSITEKKQTGFKQLKSYLMQELPFSLKKVNNPDWYMFTDYFLLKYKINKSEPLLNYFLNNAKTVKNEPENWNYEYIPCSFDLKYDCRYNNQQIGLRKFFKDNRGFRRNFLDEVFGSKKKGSRLFISHLYKEREEGNEYLLKIWGFIPEMILNNINLDLEKFQEEIDTHIKNNMFKSAQLITRVIGKKIIENVMKND